jgi:two-component system, NarL family, response regulator NreC
MIRVLLADDHLIVRQGLRALLENEGIRVVGEATQGRDAVTLASAENPDIAVLDISMPIMNGLDAATEIRKVSPQTRTILLTFHDAPEYVTTALRAGIRGYVLKTQGAHDLVEAVHQVCNGEVYLSPRISRAVVDAYLSRAEPQSDPISARERQVIQLIGEGKSTKEIAAVMGISIKTVESHRVRIMRKLDIHEVASLVRYAIRSGLVQP